MIKTQPTRTLRNGKTYELLSSGEGLVSSDEQQLPLHFTLPGETITFEEVAYKKSRFYFLEEVHKPSSERQVPVCAHFQECGGCVLQHMSNSLYKEFKKNLVTQPFLENQLDPFCIDDPVILKSKTRRRANLDVIKKNGVVHFGFHQVKSHRIVNINECHTLTPEIFNLLAPLREVFGKILSEYGKAKVFFTHLPKGVDCSVEIQGIKHLDEESQEILEIFAKENQLLRLIFRHGKIKTHIYGDERVYVDFDKTPVEIDAYSFLQASDEAEQILIDFVKNNIPAGISRIVDLFSGRGTFSIPASKYAPVDAYDLEKDAINALQNATLQHNLAINSGIRNLFDEPLTAGELSTFDLAIIDPPRAGCARQIHEIAQSRIKRVIYISCNPNTFAQDTKILVQAGYKLKRVLPIDQFLWSPHIEVAAIADTI